MPGGRVEGAPHAAPPTAEGRPPNPSFRLVPVAPHLGAPVAVPLDGAPFWVGAAADAGLPLFLPGVAARHAALIARATGPWILPQQVGAGVVRRNGEPLAEGAPLAHGDLLEFAPGVAYRVDLGLAAAPPPRPARPVGATVPPPPPAPCPAWTSRLGRAWQRWRRRPPRRRAWTGWALGAAALILVAGAGALMWRALHSGGDRSLPGADDAPAPLTERQAAEYDALVARAADRTERGAALLELGLPDAALREFGAAVTELESSPLSGNPWVRPRVDALEAGIAAVYRERRVPVPARYAAARTGPRAPVIARAARLSVDEFAVRLARVRQAFAARYGRALTVTGRDHAEHVALYGAGGAVDLRVRDLSREQVAFAVEALREAGVRVKDFSTDAVLQAQVAAARAAGLGDRAGTGLHMHADRFVDRSDRWTVR